MNRHIFWNYWNNVPREALYHFLDDDGYDWYQFTLIHTDQSNIGDHAHNVIITAKFYEGELIKQAIDTYSTISPLYKEFYTLLPDTKDSLTRID